MSDQSQKLVEQARVEFESAARSLAQANRAARAAGQRLTAEMTAAVERLSAAQQRLEQAEAGFSLTTGGPEPVELTGLVAKKVRQSFPVEQQAEVVRLLERECGRNLPFCENEDAQGLERVQLAVLKLADGSLDELRHQIAVAKEDWRDVIIQAETPEALRVGLIEFSRLDQKVRRELEALDRQQYVAWLGEGDQPNSAAD